MVHFELDPSPVIKFHQAQAQLHCSVPLQRNALSVCSHRDQERNNREKKVLFEEKQHSPWISGWEQQCCCLAGDAQAPESCGCSWRRAGAWSSCRLLPKKVLNNIRNSTVSPGGVFYASSLFSSLCPSLWFIAFPK